MLKYFTDQMGREISFEFPPRRIVSLVPSQTELLYDLGLDAEVVGQTLFCIHPANAHQAKPRVGGTKNLNIDKIKALQPDLIIGNKEENDKAQIETLAKHYPVWMSDIVTLNDALKMIEQIGKMTNKHSTAHALCSAISMEFAALKPFLQAKRTLYLIWREPWMAAGTGTFINEMLMRCGCDNIAPSERYPMVSNEQLLALQPEVILLSSEPYPFKEKHLEELKRICPNAQIMLVDGELFSWYGSRLLHSVSYFRQVIDKFI